MVLYAKQKLVALMITSTILSKTTTRSTAFTTTTKRLLTKELPKKTMSTRSMSSDAPTDCTVIASAPSNDNEAFPSSSAAIGKPNMTLIPEIDQKRRSLLMDHDINIEPLEPLGVRVTGLDLRETKYEHKPPEVWKALEYEMANRGFLVFKDQGVLTPDEQVRASILWGGQEVGILFVCAFLAISF